MQNGQNYCIWIRSQFTAVSVRQSLFGNFVQLENPENMIDLTQGARKRAEELLIAQFNFFILGFIFVNISASGRVEIDTVN